MAINILFFGKLADIAGTSMIVENAANTNDLLEQLYVQYPQLKTEKFMVAVNEKMITATTDLQDNYRVALLPPFSGG